MDQLTRFALDAGRGDELALDAVVRAGYDSVWRLCAALVDSRAADDLAQETFARIVKALPSFRGESSVRTWMLGIARHTCMDELRARTRRRDGAQRDRHASAAVHAPDASGQPITTDLLGRLDLDRRSAFVLTQILGLSYDEAAQACGCPIGTIRSRVARARNELIRHLHDGPTDESAGPAGSQSSTA